jgi:predicted TIM-barrel fold metal-dependent hydrolase
MERLGRPNATPQLLRERLEDAGFVGVEITSAKQPFGPWPKDSQRKRIGVLALLMVETACEAYAMARHFFTFRD